MGIIIIIKYQLQWGVAYFLQSSLRIEYSGCKPEMVARPLFLARDSGFFIKGELYGVVQ